MRQLQTPVHYFCSWTEPDRNIIAENAETTDVTELRKGTGWCPLESGNRGGLRLRVEFVNLLAIAVFDDSAAQLQGGGEGSIVG
jgi:hypothetical protein